MTMLSKAQLKTALEAGEWARVHAHLYRLYAMLDTKRIRHVNRRFNVLDDHVDIVLHYVSEEISKLCDEHGLDFAGLAWEGHEFLRKSADRWAYGVTPGFTAAMLWALYKPQFAFVKGEDVLPFVKMYFLARDMKHVLHNVWCESYY